MLIKTSYRDIPTSANGRAGSIRIYIIEPNVPEYPEAKFPGCVVFSEIYQVTGPVERYVKLPISPGFHSYLVPTASCRTNTILTPRFAGNIASEGYIVALPSSFHEFEGPEAIPYDTDGTDRGNKYKVSWPACCRRRKLTARSRRRWRLMMR